MMAYKEIEIPGGGTSFSERPSIEISGGGNENVVVRVTYNAGYVEDAPRHRGELTFRTVLEFRFIDEMASYEEHDRHLDDGTLGLVEIVDSEYVRTMLERSPKAIGPAGRKLADTIPDDGIHHYRLLFDDFGQIDVIALAVEVKELIAVS
jgi:hypothetical protein